MEPNNQKRTESASFARPVADANNNETYCGEKLNSLYFSPQVILSANFLDILFEGRNKEYGAYELRRSYNRRLIKAIVITSTVLLLFVLGCGIIGRSQGEKVVAPNVIDLTLAKVETPTPPVETPPPPKPIEHKIETVQFTKPLLVENPPEDQKPPVNTDLDSVRIGTVNTPGDKDDGRPVVDAPVSDGKGVVEAPKPAEEDDRPIFVELDAKFPGGMAAWIRFLQKNMRYPDDAASNEKGGQVIVQFVVDKDGNVSDVQAISGPEGYGLREEAIRVIRKSGKWSPGIQVGGAVKSYKRQRVTFQFAKE